MIFVTGDTHGDFYRFSLEEFPEQKEMTREDTMIICGDFGGVWCGDERDNEELDKLAQLPFTIVFGAGHTGAPSKNTSWWSLESLMAFAIMGLLLHMARVSSKIATFSSLLIVNTS